MNSDLTAYQCRLTLSFHSPSVSFSSGISYTSTYTLAMAPNQNHDYSLGSPPPTLACPFCPRHFKSKSGRTRHIQAIHPANGSAPGTAASATPPPLQPPPHNSSPAPHTPDTAAHISLPPQPPHDPSPVLSYDGFDANPNMDIDIEHPHPDASRISRVFHPKLNGMPIFFLLIHWH